MSDHCCDTTEKTKSQQQLAPMLIVSSKQDGTYFSAVSNCACHHFFLTQSGLRCLPICQDQMTQHHFETRTEPQPLPVNQIWKWDKSVQGFHLKRNLLKGSTTVSRKLSESYSHLSRPCVIKWQKLQTLSQGKLFCCSATKWQATTNVFICQDGEKHSLAGWSVMWTPPLSQ